MFNNGTRRRYFLTNVDAMSKKQRAEDEVIVTKKLFRVSIIFLMMTIIAYGSYQYQKPILTEQQAISNAKIYLDTVNLEMHLSYDTKKRYRK